MSLLKKVFLYYQKRTNFDTQTEFYTKLKKLIEL